MRSEKEIRERLGMLYEVEAVGPCTKTRSAVARRARISALRWVLEDDEGRA